MSSIPISAPSRQLLLTVFIVIVSLHVLTAIILAGVKMPAPVLEPLAKTPSIEIELLTLPTQTEGAAADDKDNVENKDGEAGDETKSSLESETEVATSEVVKPEVVKPEVVAPDSEVEEVIKPENVKTDVVEKVVVESENVAPEAEEPEIIASEVTESENQLTNKPIKTPATELDSLSGATASVTTTIKKSGDDAVTAGKGASGESTSGEGNAPPIAGDFAPFSRAPQSPTDNNIISNGETSEKAIYKNAGKRITDTPKVDTRMNNYNEAGIRDSSSLFITITPAPPFEHELVDADYEITDAHWLVAPKFTLINLDEYQLSNNSNNDNVTVYFSMSVDAQGRITDITTIRSSGNDKLDEVLKKDLIKARLKSFDKNGQSLAGIATLALKINTS